MGANIKNGISADGTLLSTTKSQEKTRVSMYKLTREDDRRLTLYQLNQDVTVTVKQVANV